MIQRVVRPPGNTLNSQTSIRVLPVTDIVNQDDPRLRVYTIYDSVLAHADPVECLGTCQLDGSGRKRLRRQCLDPGNQRRTARFGRGRRSFWTDGLRRTLYDAIFAETTRQGSQRNCLLGPTLRDNCQIVEILKQPSVASNGENDALRLALPIENELLTRDCHGPPTHGIIHADVE